MPRFTISLAALTVIGSMVLVTTGSSASAKPNVEHSDTASGKFYMAGVTGEPFTKMVASAASSKEGPRVVSVIAEMLRRVELGKRVTIPDESHGSMAKVPATASLLKSALAAARASSRRPGSARRGRTAVPATDPSSWPIYGVGCHAGTHGYFSWCIDKYGRRFGLLGEKCQGSTCTVTDLIDITSFTVNPASNGTTVVNYNTLYSPDGGNFFDVHWQWWVLCYSSFVICGNMNALSFSWSGPGSFNPHPEPARDLHGDYVTFAFILWGEYLPTSQWIGSPNDGPTPARTAKAQCAAAPDNNCYF